MKERIHRAVSADGTQIVSRVRGNGPPLVLVHGGLGDAELTCQLLVPWLADRFTCYAMSTRGRDLSAKPATSDYSMARMVDDVVAVADSVGAPVGLAGYSAGGRYALGAAAASSAVRAVAVYEPPVYRLSDDDVQQLAVAAERLFAHLAAGELVEAARAIISTVATEDELAALTANGTFERWARNVPAGAGEIRDANDGTGEDPIAPATLARIHVPVLYLYGAESPDWFRASAAHMATYVTGMRIEEIPAMAHFGVVLESQRVAEPVGRFFESVRAGPDPDRHGTAAAQARHG